MKKMFASSSSNQNQRGQDLIEFALALPILLLIIFGVLDLGRLFHSAITVTNAARVGARFGALRRDIYNCDPTDTDCIYICDPNCGPDYFINVTKNEALNNGIDLSTALVEPNCIDGSIGISNFCDYGDTFQIKVTYDFNLIIGELISLDQIQIVRTVDMLVQ
jgi:hypothetical protein